MALTLKGGEFILTGNITTRILSALMVLARRRPVIVNGVMLTEKEIAALEAEAQRTGKPVQFKKTEAGAWQPVTSQQPAPLGIDRSDKSPRRVE